MGNKEEEKAESSLNLSIGNNAEIEDEELEADIGNGIEFRDKLLKDNQDCTSYKIITIGDPGVGKTSLLKKLKSNDFVEEISEEVKAQTDHFYFENKEIKCKLEIWD